MKLKNNETLTKRITNCKSCSIQNDRDRDRDIDIKKIYEKPDICEWRLNVKTI